MRRDGTARQNVEHLLAVLDAASRGQDVAEHHLLARVVQLGAENEFARARQHAPSGERARDLDDVVLRVSAVDA